MEISNKNTSHAIVSDNNTICLEIIVVTSVSFLPVRVSRCCIIVLCSRVQLQTSEFDLTAEIIALSVHPE
jgi:hypothetical protein